MNHGEFRFFAGPNRFMSHPLLQLASASLYRAMMNQALDQLAHSFKAPGQNSESHKPSEKAKEFFHSHGTTENHATQSPNAAQRCDNPAEKRGPSTEYT
jgi:hypothetical protein